MASNLGDMVPIYTQRLDQLLAVGTLTSDLNMNQDLLGEFSGHGIVQIPDIDMDALGDYSRKDGFPAGDVNINWTPYKLQYDRGREFSIDVMDDEERLKIVTANIMGEFARTKVIPEVDAIRFARLAENRGTASAEASLQEITPETALKAILDAEDAIENAGVDPATCILYLTAAMRRAVREAQPYRIGQGEAPNGRFETFDDIRLRIVPQDRFVSKVKLDAGASGGSGGFSKDEAGKDLRFILVSPTACGAIQKHETLRYFPPEQNQAMDAHLWQYRLFHDLLVFKQKKDLIYVCDAGEAA